MVPPPTAVCDEQVSLPTAETSVPPQIRRPVLRKTSATATATEFLRAPLDSRPALPAVASMNAEDDMYYCKQNKYRQAQYYWGIILRLPLPAGVGDGINYNYRYRRWGALGINIK